MNRAYVDGDVERLGRFFADDHLKRLDYERWLREREQHQARGINPLAVTVQAVPLQTKVIDDDTVDTVLSLHQKLHYKLNDQMHVQENQRVQRVRMKRIEDTWAFLRPWGWYFDNIFGGGRPAGREGEGEGEGEGTPGEVAEGTAAGTPDNPQIPTQNPAGPGVVVPATPTPAEPEAVEVVRLSGYNRARGVAYAEQYWNSYNSAYPKFEVDCTNFVSQCLHAGGIPMTFTGNRGSGWWMRGKNWSYSWSVAHSLYLMMKSGKAPFYAKQVHDPRMLQPGDVICYDFDGDGRWQHNTYVVTKDANGMPLVNAHTTNSRRRYWEYKDSTAYTPKVQYGMFRIMGGQ
ncbi:amidase domain-containing protein [Brevibacillus dissolubilis]|uniref:amidase domain-containing protein n=1 Tax=Brevibacillus dissolubilis TaxID=1844116 RepID=UPI0021004630|nr:amidase domain-containing protein [Brevibacillus dissolubilis]